MKIPVYNRYPFTYINTYSYTYPSNWINTYLYRYPFTCTNTYLCRYPFTWKNTYLHRYPFTSTNTLTISSQLFLLLPPPMKMDQAECSETSADKIQTPGNHPKWIIQNSQPDDETQTKQFEIPFLYPEASALSVLSALSATLDPKLHTDCLGIEPYPPRWLTTSTLAGDSIID